jgi:hypothetical protein
VVFSFLAFVAVHTGVRHVVRSCRATVVSSLGAFAVIHHIRILARGIDGALDIRAR